LASCATKFEGNTAHESRFRTLRHSIPQSAIFSATAHRAKNWSAANHPPFKIFLQNHASLCIRGCGTRRAGQRSENTRKPPGQLKRLSLEQLGNVEVTTLSKEPEQVWRTPAAIYCDY